jgi:hypothetical protein
MTSIIRRRGSGPDRDRRDRGAVLIEAAFILPLVMVLSLAIMEFGLYFASSSTATSSTREGARQGSANFAIAGDKSLAADQVRLTVQADLRATPTLDTPIDLWVYKATSDGFPVGTTSFSSCATACYRYTWDGSKFVYDTASNAWTDPAACVGATIDSLGVYLRMRHSYFTGVIGRNATIKEHTVLRLEPLPRSQC